MTQHDLKSVVPERELLHSGHLACPACGAALAMRLVLKAMGPQTMVALPACCWSIIDGPWPVHALDIPVLHTAFETAAVVATGVKAAETAAGSIAHGLSSSLNLLAFLAAIVLR